VETLVIDLPKWYAFGLVFFMSLCDCICLFLGTSRMVGTQ